MTPLAYAALSLLREAGAEFGATQLRLRRGKLSFRLPVPRADGRAPEYELIAQAAGSIVSAREAAPTFLPTFCPERHINGDATFCMNWQAVDPIAVNDNEAAERWWGTLLQFLRLQERAAKRRRWPDEAQWAHGAAAEHQLQAQRCAALLGTEFADDLAQGRLGFDLRKVSSNGTGIRVLRSGRWIYSVWEPAGRVINLRRPCLCPLGKRKRPAIIRSCGEHADAAAGLAIALVEWKRAEQRFWKSYKGRACCGTMDGCPLSLEGAGLGVSEPAAAPDSIEGKSC